ILGGAFAECLMDSAALEYQIQKNNPGKNIKVRNMSWSGDTVYPQKYLPNSALRGGPQKRYWDDPKFNTSDRPYNFGSLETHLKKQNADTYFLFFGMTESFEGPEKLEEFKKNYSVYISKLRELKPSASIVLFSPIAQEKINEYYPEVKERNEVISKYVEAVKSVAKKEKLSFVNLFYTDQSEIRTQNGILPTVKGMDKIIAKAVTQMGMKAFPVDEEIRSMLVEKNKSFFHRWRPLNLEYIVGTRSVHTSKVPVYLTNDKDYKQDFSKHDELISQLENKVWKLCVNN
ncbi:MAG: GDSL-type esterase/lipase family protein, partial [Lentisphaeraceae bacterium]|nr:GDSL-type esterase/lipase family protein [Lentisphaeraceae bacterium]